MVTNISMTLCEHFRFSTDLPNENIAATLIRLAEQKTHLRNDYCKMSDNNQFKSKLNSLQHRMLYLLCRGPKFDREGTRLVKSKLHFQVCNRS
jgi:hypothetical protein